MNVLIRDSHAIEAARMKEIYNPAIKFYEIRYACKHGGRKYWSVVIVVSRFYSRFVTVYD